MFSWARKEEDAITRGDHYIQVSPQSNISTAGYKFAVGLGYLYERLNAGTSRRLAAKMKQQHADLIHAHFGRAGYYALPVIRRLEIPLITSFYGYDLTEYPKTYPIWREYYKRLFEAGTFFLAEGSYMRQTMIDLGCPPEKALLQRLGVDLSKIEFCPRSWQPETPLNVLQVAHVREKKGIPDSIRAFAQLHHIFPEARFTLIGDIHSKPAQPIMAEIRSILERERIEDAVRLVDKVPYETYIQILKEAHIFLHPSVIAENGDSEGGAPVSIIEASASGMMVASTQHCDIPEVIEHEITGLLAPEHTPDQLAAHLLTFARHPERWVGMAQAGRKRIETYYDLRQQVASLEDIYRRTLSTH